MKKRVLGFHKPLFRKLGSRLDLVHRVWFLTSAALLFSLLLVSPLVIFQSLWEVILLYGINMHSNPDTFLYLCGSLLSFSQLLPQLTMSYTGGIKKRKVGRLSSRRVTYVLIFIIKWSPRRIMSFMEPSNIRWEGGKWFQNRCFCFGKEIK